MGIYVMLVIGGILLLLSGLSAAYYFITLDWEEAEGCFSLIRFVSVVFSLFAIGGVLFLVGLIWLANQMPIQERLSIILSLVVLAVGLPILGGVIAQLPLFLGPYLLSTDPAGHSGWWATALAWSPDGKRIASGYYYGTVQVWDAADGRHIYTYRGHRGEVDAVAWSPDGRRVASGGGDHTVQVWDAADGGNVFIYLGHSSNTLGSHSGVRAVAWSPDGKRIASGSDDKTVQVWDAANGGNMYTYRGHSAVVHSVAWSPDGRRIASGSGSYGGTDRTVQVWDAADGGNTFTYRGHSNSPWFSMVAKYGVLAVVWSPDGRCIASVGRGTVQVWDAISGTTIFTHLQDAMNALAWSPDGKRFATGNYSKKVQVWDAATGAALLTYRRHVSEVNVVAWSPDGKRIASSDDHTVHVWDAS